MSSLRDFVEAPNKGSLAHMVERGVQMSRAPGSESRRLIPFAKRGPELIRQVDELLGEGAAESSGVGLADYYTSVEVDELLATKASVSHTHPWSDISSFAGSSLASLETRSASDLSSGTLPDGRFPATLPAVSGVNLTALNASNIASGTLAIARFPASGTWTLTGALTLSSSSSITLSATRNIFIGTLGHGIFGHTVGLPGTDPNGGSGGNMFLQTHGTNTTSSGWNFVRWQATTGGPGISLTHSRATSVGGTFAALVAGDELGTVTFGADDGGDLDTRGARIFAIVPAGATVSASRVPTDVRIATAPGLADNDLRTMVTFTSGGILSVSLGIVPITTLGPGLEIAKATGSSTIEPAYLRLRSTTAAANWDITNPWALLSFYSDDTTGLGAAQRARVGAMFENTAGSLTQLGYWTSDASALTLQFVIGSGGDVGIRATKRLYLDGTGFAAAAGNTYIVESSADVLDALAGGTVFRHTTTAFGLAANDAAALGTAALSWSDLFLASGAVVNYANGNLTLTHTSGQLSLAGKFQVTGNVAFNNKTPAAMPDYTITNPTTNRSIDVTAITDAQLRQVVATAIQDLIDIGLFQ